MATCKNEMCEWERIKTATMKKQIQELQETQNNLQRDIEEIRMMIRTGHTQ